ncbi:GNAT family N-acetyltransferase [Streptomyces olindensis]|uniref:GNAT family N-acetyltransferase n=1 Tax=Streptomyces olindensis TaxID=358823 RepID=UPI0036886D35
MSASRAVPAVAVRGAVRGDIDELIRLRAHLLDGDGATGLPYAAADAAQRDAWRTAYRSWLADRLPGGSDDRPAVGSAPGRAGTGVRIAVVDGPGRLRACATAVLDQRAPSPACPGGLAGWIQSVVTDPRDRGQGLATAVLDDLTAWLRGRGADEVVLQTTSSAAPFYRRNSFLPTGEDLLHRPLHTHDRAEEAVSV